MANHPPVVIDLTASPPGKVTTAYKNQATKLLENSFPRISCKAIAIVLKSVNFNFTEAFYVLSEIATVLPVEANVRNVYPPMPEEVRVFLKKDRDKKKHLSIRNPTLLEEIDDIPELNTKENVPPSGGDNNNNNEIAEQEEERRNDAAALVECGCCYGDFPPEDMHECAAHQGHVCCKDCIYRYVSEQLDGNNSTKFCCIVDDGCTATYPTTTLLDNILTPKLKKRVHDREYRVQIEKAGIEGLWICPKCANMGFVDQQYSTVHCNPCQTEYCRMCNEAAHKDMTCKEARGKQERLKDPIHRAHEAMSRATIRSCPSCATEFQKYDGCNKMTCPKCKTLSCYLCEQKIDGYKHFCAKWDCACGLCKLWDKAEERDRQARRQAGLKELEGANLTPEEIEQVLASPSGKNFKAPSTVQQQQGAPVINHAPAQQIVAPPDRRNVNIAAAGMPGHANLNNDVAGVQEAPEAGNVDVQCVLC